MSNPLLTRRELLLSAAAIPSIPALAQGRDGAGQNYAVISLVGDRITAVGFQPSVGSNRDTNERKVTEISSPVFDNSVLLAVDDAIRLAQPRAATTLLATRDPKLFALQDRPLDSAGDAAEAVAAMRVLLQQAKATRMILVAPYRTDARFQLARSTIGTGTVAGLGVYVDRVTRIQFVEDGNRGTGFIAPYVYVSVSLVDAQTFALVRRELVTESDIVPTQTSKTAIEPWDALTNDEKVSLLRSLIRRGIARAVPALLSGA